VMELSHYRLEALHEDGEFILWRGLCRITAKTTPQSILVLSPMLERPAPATLQKIEHEFSLKDELDPAWAIRPIALTQHDSRIMLLFEDVDGEPIDRLLGRPLELKHFLRCGIGLAAALGHAHRRGLIHKDIKPSNAFVNAAMDQAWLTGFGIASRMPRERQAAEPPEFISGTLAYMAPEQTGRMNRSIDSRSDLYALGITLYELLTGSLPFTASDAMEWVHCHIARQPLAPAEQLRDIPRSVSAIIMKLLAKTPEERYQTATGLENDLRRCLEDWDSEGGIHDFPLGERDTPDRVLIPEKLYGREREIETLLASFDRVLKSRTPELVLVSGHSGIGKSSVVKELHKVLVPPRGLFASGKFDQYKRDIPYSTLGQALQSLIRRLLAKRDSDLATWRDAIREALDPNGRLMIDLVPELRLIIGEQPPVPDLPPQEAQRRFQLVFRRFIGVFARPEHPLALFLDDLQWLDLATLEVLEDLLTHADVHHLLMIGAYRDNEVDAAHPLAQKLEGIRKAGARIKEIKLAQLSQENVGQLLVDALQCEPERALPLAQLIYHKTLGNPFFLAQFLSALEYERLLAFNHARSRWSWDLDRIHAKGYTDNVVDLMIGKLRRLPAETQNALQQLACLGNAATVTTLSMVYGTGEAQVHSDLFEALRAEVVEWLEGSYRFVHDRVQEAAYSLLPERLRPNAHLRIGRLLLAHTPPAEREEAIFEIVNQLNRSTALIVSREEREELAGLNWIAGKRAKSSAAHASALTYLVTGADLLPEDSWDRRHDLTFALALNRAECEYVTAQFAPAEERLTALTARAATLVEQAAVAALRVDLYTMLDQCDRALIVGLDYLRHLGVEWSPHPTAEDARREYERIWSQLGTRAIEDLIELPVLSDATSLATLEVLQRLIITAYPREINLHTLISCRAVNLSIERGNCDASCYAYVWLGVIAGAQFGDYKAGYRFGRLGYELIEQHGWKRLQPRTYEILGSLVIPWTRPVAAARDLLRRAFEGARSIGDVMFAVGSCTDLISNLLVAGDPLGDVQREAEHGLEFANTAQFGVLRDIIAPQLGLVRTLRGLTRQFGSFDDEQFDELLAERRLAGDPNLQVAECSYWIRKLQARFFAGDDSAAVDASREAKRLLGTYKAQLEEAEYHFYSALCRAACCDSVLPDERQKHLEGLVDHHKQLEIWAENCPENFANRVALVGAEIARLEGRVLEAEQQYEQAIRSAHSNGFVNNEAIAYEVAARFYAARGFQTISRAYLRNARYGYLRWGADGKVRQLDQLYPYLKTEEAAAVPGGQIGAQLDQLDLATVIKVSQAVSGEIVLEKFLDTLMRAALEHAGAARALLILSRGAEQRVVAEATTGSDAMIVRLIDEPISASVLPETVFRYVLHTHENVILDDATIDNPFSVDPYLRVHHARSVLCLPLSNRAKLIGVLYLENNLAPRVFAPARIAVLRFLASQAATSLENARLYSDLRDADAYLAKAQRLSHTGSFGWKPSNGAIYWSEETFRIFEFDESSTPSTDLLERQRIHPEDVSTWRQVIERAARDGHDYAHEFRLRMLDGRVKHLQVAAHATRNETNDVHFFGAVMDVTAIRVAEMELHKTRTELADAARMTRLGALTASIAHEVNQPLMAIETNAESCLLWLAKDQIDKARASTERIVKNCQRAAGVVKSIRAQARKSASEMVMLDISRMIADTLELMQSELHQHDISLETRFSRALGVIKGDRTQLQQVIVNLVMNAIEAMSTTTGSPRILCVITEAGPNSDLLIAVEDSGSGIAAGTLDRIFDPMFTTKSDGMGLGLSICRSIVEAHGGRLWAIHNPTGGSIFRFSIPRATNG
jgi:predicted ATPase/signal transduction histidine kinase